MTTWRRALHADPEVGFEERHTAAFVAAKLWEFGLDDVAEGVGGTGVVGTLTRGANNRAIALRADMDALRMTEKGQVGYSSRNPGLMHACGHDGHTAMLLGACGSGYPQPGYAPDHWLKILPGEALCSMHKRIASIASGGSIG